VREAVLPPEVLFPRMRRLLSEMTAGLGQMESSWTSVCRSERVGWW